MVEDMDSNNFEQKCLKRRTNRGFGFFAPWPSIACIFCSLSGDISNIFDVGALIYSNSVPSAAIISGGEMYMFLTQSDIITNI